MNPKTPKDPKGDPAKAPGAKLKRNTGEEGGYLGLESAGRIGLSKSRQPRPKSKELKRNTDEEGGYLGLERTGPSSAPKPGKAKPKSKKR